MKYNFLSRSARSSCIKEYSDFFDVLKNLLGGVVQPKYASHFMSHASEVLGFMCEIGLLKRVYVGGLLIYQLQYSDELSSRNVRKITREMIIRSALRMKHYKSLGMTGFDEIKKYGQRGNNRSENINKELLLRYDTALNKRGILIENLTSPDSVSLLYKLKAQNVYIDFVKVNDRTIKPQISIYNINIDKPNKMSGRIAFAYSEITSLFTDYIADVKVEPTIYIHEFGDMEMFNSLVCTDLLKNHFQEMGCYDIESLQEKVIFKVYENRSKTPYSNILN